MRESLTKRALRHRLVLRGYGSTASSQAKAVEDGTSSPERIIVLNCYGRGGSGIVWRMIGSSPDVIMTGDEWHVGVFGGARLPRKGALLAFRSLGISSFEPLRRYAFKKTIEMQRPGDLARSLKPDPASSS